MTRKVRIEEIIVGCTEEFSRNVWIESESLEYSDTLIHNNENWIVVATNE